MMNLTPAQQSEQNQRANLSNGRKLGVKKTRTNSSKLPHILRMLLEGATVAELIQETGIGYQAAARLIKSLRYPMTDRIIYIYSWEKTARKYIPVYKIGEGHDRPRPAKLSDAERAVQYRARQKQIKLAQLIAGNNLTNLAASKQNKIRGGG